MRVSLVTDRLKGLRSHPRNGVISLCLSVVSRPLASEKYET